MTDLPCRPASAVHGRARSTRSRAARCRWPTARRVTGAPARPGLGGPPGERECGGGRRRYSGPPSRGLLPARGRGHGGRDQRQHSTAASRCSPPPPTRRCGGSGGTPASCPWPTRDAVFSSAARAISGPAPPGRAPAGSGRRRWRASGGGNRNELRPVVDAFARSPAAIGARRPSPRSGEGLPARRPPGLERGLLVAHLASRFPQRLLPSWRPSGRRGALADGPGPPDRRGRGPYPQREALGEDEPHYEIAGERAETSRRCSRQAARSGDTAARHRRGGR